jgi:hypothetical protein
VIYSDICGPFPVSRGNKKYFLSFIDENSRFKWIFLIERREEIFNIFMEFIKYLETQFKRTPKVLRSDGAGEYTSERIESFIKLKGKTTNQTLLNSIRAMLEESKLDQSFWGEAAATAVYICNRCVTAILKNKTPFEALNGFKPDVSHLRVFGTRCFYKVLKNGHKKLDVKASEGILLGYINESI